MHIIKHAYIKWTFYDERLAHFPFSCCKELTYDVGWVGKFRSKQHKTFFVPWFIHVWWWIELQAYFDRSIYLPSERAMAKNGTLSIFVLRRTGPWCWLGWQTRFQATRNTPLLLPISPPSDSILSFSSGLSGLWSFVKGIAFNVSPTLDAKTTLESPTLATNMWRPRRITTETVVPAVLGIPCLVLGQESGKFKK